MVEVSQETNSKTWLKADWIRNKVIGVCERVSVCVCERERERERKRLIERD